MYKKIETIEEMFPENKDQEKLKVILVSVPKVSNLKVIISGNVFEVFKFKYPIKLHKNPREEFTKRYEETEEDYGKRITEVLERQIKEEGLAQERNKIKKEDIPKLQKIHEKSLYRSKQNVRRLIFANAWKHKCYPDGYYQPQFITFTFAENITDVTEANYLFNKYIKRLNYKLKSKAKNSVCYITVIEFQKRGAVHYHTIFFNLPLIDIHSEFQTGLFAETWGHGFIKVKHINEAKGVASYLTKYLTKENMDTRLISRKKYFCSRNVKRPFIIRDVYRAQNMISELEQFEIDYEAKYSTPGGNEVNYLVHHLTNNELTDISYFEHLKHEFNNKKEPDTI
jgi:hypothetical protein